MCLKFTRQVAGVLAQPNQDESERFAWMTKKIPTKIAMEAIHSLALGNSASQSTPPSVVMTGTLNCSVAACCVLS